MSQENTEVLVCVMEGRKPVPITAVQTGNVCERGRSPVPITPVQTQSSPAQTPTAPATDPLKKD